MKKLFALHFSLFYGLLVLAQTNLPKNPVGQVKSGEFVVTKKLSGDLILQERIFSAADDSVSIDFKDKGEIKVEDIDFNLEKKEDTFQLALPTSEVVRFSETGSEAMIGFGSYLSPTFSLTHFNRRGPWRYGAQYFNESYLRGPVRGEESAQAYNRISLHADRQFERSSWESDLAYDRLGYFFYGVPDSVGNNDAVTERSHWNVIHLRTRWQSHFDRWNYSITPVLAFAENGINGGESFGDEVSFGWKGQANLFLRGNESISLKTDFTFSRSNWSVSRQRFVNSVTPSYQTFINDIALSVGLQFNQIEDDIEDKIQVGAVMRATVPLDEHWSLSLGLDNEVSINPVVEVYHGNNFLSDSLDLRSTITNTPFYAQIDGIVFRGFALNVRAALRNIENARFFVPDSRDPARFVILYDSEGLTSWNYSFGFTWNIQKDWRMESSYNFFDNTTESIESDWYYPASSLQVSMIKAWNKWTISSSMETIAGLKAPVTTHTEPVELPTIVKIDGKVIYNFNPFWTTEFSVQNALDRNYEYFLGYPSRGAVLRAVVRVTF